MMILLYRLIFLPILLLAAPWYLYRMWRRGGYSQGFMNRFGICRKVPPKRVGVKRIWIQAVSVGELNALARVIEAIDADPGYELVITTTTSTGRAILEKRYAHLSAWRGYFPLDFWLSSRSVWQALDPDIAVLMEGELWPEHIHQAHLRAAPLLLINARLSDRSFQRHFKWRIFTRRWFRHLDSIIAGSESDANRFRQLDWVPAKRISNGGNLKLDLSPPSELSESKLRTFLAEAGWGRNPDAEAPIILLGSSTWPGEEKVLVTVYQRLRKTHPRLRLLLVPRHAERRGEIRNLLKSEEVGFHLRSENLPDPPANAVYVADTTGELARLTQLADLVFIGKSLPPNRGGQSPVDAAAVGKPLLFGPEMSNFKDLSRRLLNAGAAREVSTETELEEALSALLQSPRDTARMRKAARELIAASAGASERVLAALRQL
jgi:3-deoxy-D-manno-octulosonic-acid transferase